MAIIEKPSGPVQIFASSEEARERGASVIDVPITDFVDSLRRPEVQEVLALAQARCDENPVE